jgi:hypothetical protein
MNRLAIPRALREQLGEPGSEALVDTFAAAHTVAVEHLQGTVRAMEDRFDSRLCGIENRFEHRLADVEGRLRRDIGDLKFELLKWSFLFWVAQVAAVAGILSVLLRSR